MTSTVRYKSTADYVTAEIQRLILSGELPPGARVDQIELATQLEVSRHPVRQAIERLAERGFIILHPHRSAIIAEISVEDMDELYRARRVVEEWAIRQSWERGTPPLAADVMPAFKQLERADAAQDLEAYMAANRAFHLAMYQGCGNRYILRTITSLFDLSERYQRTALHHKRRVDRSHRDHKAMMKALAADDCDQLLSLITAHNEGTQAMVRAAKSGKAAA
jgi:DNA-binding GntR family transcriptional regulator